MIKHFHCLLVAWSAMICPLAAADKPNIVFILADDLGRQDASYRGSSLYQTPNIDRLAKDGMDFSNAYCCHPRCVPSRYGIMSGRIPSRDGVPGFEDRASPHTLPLARVTFAERLRDAGYATGYIGKWHLGKEGGEPDKQGFSDSRIAGEAGAPNSYFYPFHIAKSGQHKENEVFPVVPGKEGEYLTDRITSEAVDFLRTNKDKPFLLVIAHYAVHTPFQAPEKLVTESRERLRAAGSAEGGRDTDPDFKDSDRATDKTVHNNPVYGAMLRSLDDGVGRVLAELDALKLADNTVVVFSSDHGGLSTRGENSKRPLATSNLPYRHGKGWLYDGGLRVPLIVRWPGVVKPGSVSTAQTINTDHYASFLGMAGLQPDAAEATDSRSYLPALRGESPERGPMFFHSPQSRPGSTGDRNASALIQGNWKIFKHLDTGVCEIYDLAADPGERKDLAASEPARLADMKADLEKIATTTNARQGGNNPFGGDKPARGKKATTVE